MVYMEPQNRDFAKICFFVRKFLKLVYTYLQNSESRSNFAAAKIFFLSQIFLRVLLFHFEKFLDEPKFFLGDYGPLLPPFLSDITECYYFKPP